MPNSRFRLIHYQYFINFATALVLTGCGGIFYSPPTAAEYCGIDPTLLELGPVDQAVDQAVNQAQDKRVIELWAAGERHFCWRAYAPLLAAHQRPELNLSVRVRNLEINNNPFTDQLMALADRGQAPDVAYVSHSNAVRLGEAGYLHLLEECIQKSEFQPVPDEFWHSFATDRRAWGIPVDTDLLLLFYNKGLLRQLGWTQTQIDSLPKRVLDGTFTLQDLIATAKMAVETGVVQSGLAFIPSRGQEGTIKSIYSHLGGKFHNEERSHLVIEQSMLEETYDFLATLHRHELLAPPLRQRRFNDWGNKLMTKDAAAHNRFLFWHVMISEMQGMAEDYADTSGDAKLLSERIGVSLLPTTTVGKSGYTRVSYSGQYVIFAENATGRGNQTAACELLAATHGSGLLKEHAQESGYATFSQDGLYTHEWFPTVLLAEHLQFRPPRFPEITELRNILAEVGVLVERGEATASEAADMAVERLRDTFGSQLIVE